MCGLSHKQRLRRQVRNWGKAVVGGKLSQSSNPCDESTNTDRESIGSYSEEESRFNSPNGVCDISRTSSMTSEEDSETPHRKLSKTRKTVSFYGAVSVILIPSIQEYRQANLMDRLWWSKKDFQSFECDLVSSLQACMARTQCFDYKRALKMLADEVDVNPTVDIDPAGVAEMHMESLLFSSTM